MQHNLLLVDISVSFFLQMASRPSVLQPDRRRAMSGCLELLLGARLVNQYTQLHAKQPLFDRLQVKYWLFKSETQNTDPAWLLAKMMKQQCVPL